jgi:cell division septation protein DedD
MTPTLPSAISTEPTIELPVGPAPEEIQGPIAGAGETIGLPKAVPPVPPAPVLPIAAAKPHPIRQPRPSQAPLFSPAVPTPPVASVAAVAAVEGRYTIQVGAYAQAENSAETVATLSRRGYTPYVVEIHGARGLLHVVRVGRYPDRGTAARAASDLRRKARMEAIVQPVSKARSGEVPESTGGIPGEATERSATSG